MAFKTKEAASFTKALTPLVITPGTVVPVLVR